MSLKILTKSREEAINFLTDLDGKLPENVSLITLVQPDEQHLLTDSDRSLTAELLVSTTTMLSLTDAFRILKRFYEYRNRAYREDLTIYICCKDGLTYSGAVADWAMEYCRDVVDFAESTMFGLLFSPSKSVRDKLYFAQYLKEEFSIDIDELNRNKNNE